MKDKFDFAKVDVDCQAESHRILSIYIRYMLRKFRFKKYNHSIFQTCPRYNDYFLHIAGLILRAKESKYKGNNNFFYPQSKCKELDILVARFLSKKYKVNLTYNNKVKIKRDIYYKDFKLSLLFILRDIFFEFKERKTSPRNKKRSINKKNLERTVLILAHNLSTGTKAYKNLPKKLSKFFRNHNKKSKIILPEYIGLTLKDKFRNLIFILFELFLKLRFSLKFKLSDIHFIIFRIYQNIYKQKLKRFLLKNKIEKIICSYINYEYEPTYYDAARDLKIKYFTYDYSIGYPIKNYSYLRYLPDTRKFSDVVFASSYFREEQYNISSRFLDKPPKIESHVCPQYDFSIIKNNYLKLNKSKPKIGIVDNIFFEDLHITYEDINSLLKFLSKSNHKLEYILQSKRGILEKELRILKNKDEKIISGEKGDFSYLKNADLIISIGWQSIALKAANAFKKPVLFYSRFSYPYEEHFFSTDKIKNRIMNDCCKILWSNKSNFSDTFYEIFSNKEYYQFINEVTFKLLTQIGFHDKKIEDYFQIYFH